MSKICDTLKENQRLAQIQNPPLRYTPINPYTSTINTKTGKPFTSFDFNMRRKVEILKYAPNKQSTQTNSLTKSQKWGQIISGNYQTESYSIQTIRGNTYLNGKQVDITNPSIQVQGCQQNRSQPTLSTLCGVPGIPIYLYEDDTVPLYNFNKNINTFAQQNKINAPNWYIESYNDITTTITIPSTNFITSFISGLYTTTSTVATLYLVTPIYSISTYNISIPIGIYIGGTSIYNYQGTITPIIVNLNSVNLTVLNKKTPIHISPTYSYQQLIANLLDISVNKIPENSTYSVAKYIGVINISNIVLPSASGYVYDFQISYTLDISGIDITSSPRPYNYAISNTVVGVVSNITSELSNNAFCMNVSASIPNIPSSLNYAIIQNPSNGFLFSEN